MSTLLDFTPKLTTQVGTNCFAYASAYVALTTMRCYSHGLRDPQATDALSFGFVDGAVQYLKGLGYRQFTQDVGDALYDGNTDDLGNLDFAFYILFKYGTTSLQQFPYREEDEIRRHFDPASLTQPDLVKIGKPVQIFTPWQGYSDALLAQFNQYLSQGKPIIISIEQPRLRNCVWVNIDTFEPNQRDTSGNHIVTLIGYDGDKLQVKNNYDLDCSSWYAATDIFKIMKWAYVYP